MTLKVGIVGTGWFSKVHADLLAGMEDVRLQAVCGSSKAKGEDMARPYDAAGCEKARCCLYLCASTISWCGRTIINQEGYSLFYRKTA